MAVAASATTDGIVVLFGIVCVVVARGGTLVLDVGAIGIAIASAIALAIGSATCLTTDSVTLGIFAVVFCEESIVPVGEVSGAIKSADVGLDEGTLM